jgi:hypothetical protein
MLGTFCRNRLSLLAAVAGALGLTEPPAARPEAEAEVGPELWRGRCGLGSDEVVVVLLMMLLLSREETPGLLSVLASAHERLVIFARSQAGGT